jgi:hypothetical protein
MQEQGSEVCVVCVRASELCWQTCPYCFPRSVQYKKVIHIPCITTAHMRKVKAYVQMLLMHGSPLIDTGLGSAKFFSCNPILFAVCTSTLSKLCRNVYSGM